MFLRNVGHIYRPTQRHNTEDYSMDLNCMKTSKLTSWKRLHEYTIKNKTYETKQNPGMNTTTT
jgi:hypothetical protein